MVQRIEKIVDGQVIKQAARYQRRIGSVYECFERGQTADPYWFDTLDEVAEFLRAAPRRRVRMEPGSAMTTNNIHIDGRPLEV